MTGDSADQAIPTADPETTRAEYGAIFETVSDALFLLHVDDAGTIRFQRFNEREETITYEEEVRIDGEPTTWRTTLTPIFEGGRIHRIVGSSREITERKQRERALEQLHDVTRDLIRATTVEEVATIACETATQLLENLFRNAVEHGGPDVTVEVGALEDGFFVEDDGPGIPSDARDEVFDVGYSSADDGSGFGLSIVRRIATAHGWDISVTEGTDGGARFEITDVSFVE